MSWLQLITTIFDICWLSAVLLLLWAIWRTSASHIRTLIQALANAAQLSAQAAKQAAEAAERLAEQARERKHGP